MWKAIQTVCHSRLPASVHLKNNLIMARPSSVEQMQISLFSVSAGSGSCSSLGAIGVRFEDTRSNSFLRPWTQSQLQGQRQSPEESLIASCRLNQSVTPYVPSRGMKIKGRVNRRCKDCELVWQDGILYNFCATHPRHKQMLKQQYWPNLRILTHATTGPRLPWKSAMNGFNRRSIQ